MARIIFADDGIRFDGRIAETAPLGGAETAVVGLAEALAQRGHAVTVYNKCDAPLDWNGVAWRPIGAASGLPDAADLYVANRGDRLLPLVPHARRRIFWIHNPAGYLLKWRYLWKLARWRPVILFSGAFHASTYPRWAPDGGRTIVPLGVAEAFRTPPEPDSNRGITARPPPRRAVFTSNPMRSLDWLLDLWSETIRPRVPGAELHVFSGPQTYGGSAVGETKAAAMRAVLAKAERLAASGVLVRGAITKPELARELRQARLFLYRGDPGETFCLAAAEAQASGLPAVVQDIACLRERVADGETGFVAKDAPSFADAAVRLLTDDALWRAQHAAALARGVPGWGEAAEKFETFLTPFGELAKSIGPGT